MTYRPLNQFAGKRELIQSHHLVKRQLRSDGSAGEQAAEYYFPTIGWSMDRHQPKTKTAYINGKPTVIHCRSDGVADYTGFRISDNEYRACEVKEASGDSMPCSRLDKSQRDWMAARPAKCMFVGIYWMTGVATFEVFPFKEKGSYQRGYGTCQP